VKAPPDVKTTNESDFESVESANNLHNFNEVIGVYVEIHIKNKATYEQAAATIAVRQDYRPTLGQLQIELAHINAYPWIDDVVNGAVRMECPPWNRLAEDLIKSEKYRIWLLQKTVSFLQPPGKADRSSPKIERVANDFAFVLSTMHSILCGRIGAYLKMLEKPKKSGETWLDRALLENNKIPQREISRERGLPQEPNRKKKKTCDNSEAEQIETGQKKRGPKKIVLLTNTDQYRDEDPPEAEDRRSVRPEDQAEKNELMTKLLEARKQLVPQQLEILKMLIDQGMTAVAVAETCGIAVCKVKELHSAAIARLRDILNPNEQ